MRSLCLVEDLKIKIANVLIGWRKIVLSCWRKDASLWLHLWVIERRSRDIFVEKKIEKWNKVLRTDIFEIVGYGEAERVGSEFRVPKNKKSAIFVIIRGSFNPRLRGSENCEIRDFWFFGISSSVFRVRDASLWLRKETRRGFYHRAHRDHRGFYRKERGEALKRSECRGGNCMQFRIENGKLSMEAWLRTVFNRIRDEKTKLRRDKWSVQSWENGLDMFRNMKLQISGFTGLSVISVAMQSDNMWIYDFLRNT